MKNERGRKIPEEKVEEIARRVSKLPKEDIDELFYKVGFIVHEYKDEEKPDTHKALLPKQIDKIKENGEESGMVRNLLWESPLEDVLEELDKLES